jgi:hypothetical protein
MGPHLDRADVRLVLTDHEHNFQIGEMSRRTYVVSGAGGKVREEQPDELGEAGAEAWAAHAHLPAPAVRRRRQLTQLAARSGASGTKVPGSRRSREVPNRSYDLETGTTRRLPSRHRQGGR